MSVPHVHWVLESPLVKGASMRLVLVSLAERADIDGVCWPSVTDTARRAGLTVRQAKRLLHNLEHADRQIVSIGGGKGPRDTKTYIVVAGRDAETVEKLRENLEKAASAKGDTGDTHRPDTASEPRVTSETKKGDIQGAARVTSRAAKGDTGDTRTISEPSATTIIKPQSREDADKEILNEVFAGADAGEYDLDFILQKIGFKPSTWAKLDGKNRVSFLLNGCGCDLSFRSYLAKNKVFLKDLLPIADQLFRKNGSIRNPAGWLRRQLQKRGIIAASAARDVVYKSDLPSV
jgi:hypothetical protein